MAPSRCRSSSAARVSRISATTSRGRILSARGWVRSTTPASASSRPISSAMRRRMPGRNTFTTTSRGGLPSTGGRVAACTCAIEAEASGVVSKLAKASATGRPSACSTIARAASPSKGATRSCSSDSSTATSGGIRSRRVDRICPNLTKIGPSSCSAKRKRAPRGSFAISADARGTNGRASRSQRAAGVPSSRSSSPWRNSTRPMRQARRADLTWRPGSAAARSALPCVRRRRAARRRRR